MKEVNIELVRTVYFVCFFVNMIKIVSFMLMYQLKHKIIDLTMVKFTPKKKRRKKEIPFFFHT